MWQSLSRKKSKAGQPAHRQWGLAGNILQWLSRILGLGKLKQKNSLPRRLLSENEHLSTCSCDLYVDRGGTVFLICRVVMPLSRSCMQGWNEITSGRRPPWLTQKGKVKCSFPFPPRKATQSFNHILSSGSLGRPSLSASALKVVNVLPYLFEIINSTWIFLSKY